MVPLVKCLLLQSQGPGPVSLALSKHTCNPSARVPERIMGREADSWNSLASQFSLIDIQVQVHRERLSQKEYIYTYVHTHTHIRREQVGGNKFQGQRLSGLQSSSLAWPD